MSGFHKLAVATVILILILQSRCRATASNHQTPGKHAPLQPENEPSVLKSVNHLELGSPDLQNNFLSEEEHPITDVVQSGWWREYLNTLKKIDDTGSFKHDPYLISTDAVPEDQLSIFDFYPASILKAVTRSSSSDIIDFPSLGDAKPQQQTLKDSSHRKMTEHLSAPPTAESPTYSNWNSVPVNIGHSSTATSFFLRPPEGRKPSQKRLPDEMTNDENAIESRIIGGRAATYSGIPIRNIGF